MRKLKIQMLSESVDMSTVGQINYSWDFDQDEYAEWLQDEEEQDSEENRKKYIEWFVSFDVEYLDNETFHTFDTESMDYDGLVSEFGEKVAGRILHDCMESGNGSMETYEMYEDEEVDINDPDSLNSMAMKLLQHGEYYKGCRGFILSNGEVVYTPNEHNQCTIIDGVKGTLHFVELGNIRLLGNSIDLSRKPTREQRAILRQVIGSYADGELFMDIMDGNGVYGIKYVHPTYSFVIGEIDRYFDEGIKPQGKVFEERQRTIIITESQYKRLVRGLMEDKILEYLDKDFGMPLYNAAKKEFGEAEVVKTTWLVHSADSDRTAEKIMRDGFSNGLSRDELNKDAMTYSNGKKHEDDGYSWAYRSEKFMGANRKSDYCTSILFQASGVEYMNPMDGVKQVLFHNKSAKNCILIYNWDGEENKKDKFSTYHDKTNLYAVGNVNGKPLYIGYFGDVVEWCINNFDQYRENLLGNDKVLHVSEKTDRDYESYLDMEGHGDLPKDAINKYARWHDFEEQQDDIRNADDILKNAYRDFLEKHSKEVNEVNKKINNLAKEYPQLKGNMGSIKETLMSAYGISFEQFSKEFFKDHAFYDRKRPDREYWRKR